MIRIAQFSDLHYSGKHLAEADRCFSHAIDRAIGMKVDAAVISGDSTDHALDMHAPAVLRLASNIRRLAEHCPILMLQGTYSHEPPGTLALFRLLGGRYPVHVADRIGQVALSSEGNWIASDGWCFDQFPCIMRALFSCVPTVNKATVAATVGAASAAVAVGEQLGVLLAGFAPSNRAARESGIPTIGVSHGTVYGCMSEHGVPMAGFDHEFTTGTLFGAQAQAFMLGHIHRHQEWVEGGRRIAYPGSIGRFHYGEDGEKGFLLWDVDATTARLAFDPTPARRTIDICFEGKPDIDALQTAIKTQEVTGAFVRVRWSIGDEDRHEVDRDAIGRMLSDAAEVKLEGRIVPVVRTRAAGMSQAATIADKVRAWARATEAKADPLLACLECLHTFAPDAIASEILGRSVEAPVQKLPDARASASHVASRAAADTIQDLA
ncbi:MAG: metallophosphatase family protein [Pseudomonadota bacterium]